LSMADLSAGMVFSRNRDVSPRRAIASVMKPLRCVTDRRPHYRGVRVQGCHPGALYVGKTAKTQKRTRSRWPASAPRADARRFTRGGSLRSPGSWETGGAARTFITAVHIRPGRRHSRGPRTGHDHEGEKAKDDPRPASRAHPQAPAGTPCAEHQRAHIAAVGLAHD